MKANGGREFNTFFGDKLMQLAQKLEVNVLRLLTPITVYLYLFHVLHTVGFVHLAYALPQLFGKLGWLAHAIVGDKHGGHHLDALWHRVVEGDGGVG